MDLPQNILHQQIRRGAILHSTIFEEIDHGKFFVVIGVYQDYIAGFFFINSNINKYIINKPEQLAMQYQLKEEDYDFLIHDSYLCATNIIKRPIEHLTDSLEKGITKFVGQLKEQHLNDVIKMVRQSRLFSKADKDKYLS